MSDFESSVEAMGAKLKQMRQGRGLRQVDVAAMAGLPRLKVMQVEAGRPGVAVSSYVRVAGALGAQFELVPAQRPTLEEIGALIGDDRG